MPYELHNSSRAALWNYVVFRTWSQTCLRHIHGHVAAGGNSIRGVWLQVECEPAELWGLNTVYCVADANIFAPSTLWWRNLFKLPGGTLVCQRADVVRQRQPDRPVSQQLSLAACTLSTISAGFVWETLGKQEQKEALTAPYGMVHSVL